MKIENYLSKFSKKAIQLVGPTPTSIMDFPGPCLYIDGGAKQRKSAKGFSLGDNDSFSGQLDHVLPTKKDFSDLSYALSHCHNFQELYLYGFLGKRRDHELINFGEVHHFLGEQTRCKVMFENEVIALSAGQWDFNFDQRFSLFCFKKTLISLSGEVEYSLDQEHLKPYSSHGLSNHARGKFSLNCHRPCFIFLT